jgi:Flp pilus assembly protein TadG
MSSERSSVGGKRRRCRGSRQRGQVFAVTAVSMVGLCGIAGFSIDASSWYQAHRHQQSIADAAALAAADSLPTNTAQATSDAIIYAQKNGGSLSGSDVTFSTTYSPDDTVTVKTSATAPSYFLKVLGFGSASVGATATATAVPLGSAYGAAPFAVYYTQPELSGPSCPCFGVQTTLSYNKVGPGGFEIINIDGSSGGSGQTILSNWILNGCSCSTDAPTWLWGDAGAKFNSSQTQAALDQRIGSILLFPVYDNTQAGGSNMQYHVIAFVGFNVTSYKFNGSNNGTITGSFEKVTWKGTGASSSPGPYSATYTRLTG